MDQHCASNIASLVREYARLSLDDRYCVQRDISERPLEGFRSDADHRPCEGAFLVRRADGVARWLLVIAWRDKGEYYIVLLSQDKSSRLAELRKVEESGKKRILHWDYRPRRRDERNEQRKRYFKSHYGDSHVAILLPIVVEQVADFISALFTVAECRIKADRLEEESAGNGDGFPEGRTRERLHRERERNSEVTRRAKAEALLKHGRLRCQCCDFDFKDVYGLLGEGYIEAHHTKPVSELLEDGEETKIEDIALVCSNCHGMLHRKRPWLGMSELKSLIA